jgi:hypothetical protein
MAKRRRRSAVPADSDVTGQNGNGGRGGGTMDPDPEATTGRYLVTLREDALQAGLSAIGKVVGASKIARAGTPTHL